MEEKKFPAYQILLEGGQGEIEEKKSRFIANLIQIESEEEALEFIETINKKYWDARHNCYAYILGERGEYMRFSDDGEPQGTAGKPILEVLQHAGLRNIIVVVTRYFGGTLLGTGGLIRAYTEATKAGLHNCIIGKMIYGVLLEMKTDYNGIGKILYLLGKQQMEAESADYQEDVTLTVRVPYEKLQILEKSVIEATNGQVKLEEKEWNYFVDKGKKD